MYTWIACLALTFIAIQIIRPAAVKLGLVDYPNTRKHHKTPVPLVGGIAMFIGFSFSLLLLPISLSAFRGLIAASALLVLVGMLDDLHDVSARWRFGVQIMAGLFMGAWGSIVLYNLGDLLGLGYPLILYGWGVPLTVFSVLGILNAVNMMDGLDGLAGSLALVTFSFLAYVAWYADLYNELLIIGLFIAVLLAFLWFNFPWRKAGALIFMGDAGSLFLGMGLVWFLVALSQGEHPAVRPVTMLWFIAVPLFDVVFVTLQRLLKKRSPFVAGRDHCHHLLLSLGFSQKRTVSVMVIAAILLGVFGLLGEYLVWTEGFMMLLFMTLFFTYCLGSVWLWRKV